MLPTNPPTENSEFLDDSSKQNLIALLRSPQTENVVLGLSILQKNYTPDTEIDTCLLALALFSLNTPAKAAVKKFIQKKFSPQWLEIFSQHKQKGKEKEAYEALKTADFLDLGVFANTATLAVQGEKYNYGKFGHAETIGLGGVALSAAVAALYERETLDIWEELEKIVPVPEFWDYLPKLQPLERLNLRNPNRLFQQKLFALPQKINHLTINILDSDFLDDSVGQLAHLEVLEFREYYRGAVPRRALCAGLARLKKLKDCRISSNILSEYPDWFSEWTALENFQLNMDEGLDLRPLFRLKNIQRLVIYAVKEKHPSNWENFDAQNCFPNLKKCYLHLSGQNALHSEQTLLHFLRASGQHLQEFKYADTSLDSLPDFWIYAENIAHLTLHGGGFKSLPSPTTVCKLQKLTLISFSLENLQISWEFFPQLTQIEILSELPTQKQLRAQVPKHIRFKFLN